ncbi:Fructose-1,6-bisphosphatase/inositol-1-monophosphatase [Candidatus Anstonella stagnisolia]|nr:Fructose-1,6-bisphosphatase/inositol-1-monophosphatase [Candidatus Anstonella stagnisolia]
MAVKPPAMKKVCKELVALNRIVKQAGEGVMGLYEARAFESHQKADNTPATGADALADAIIRKGILGISGVPILSEEQETFSLWDGTCWVVDPLDGTKNFMRGEKDFCIMAGLLEHGKPAMGCVYVPAKKELLFAQKGKGAYVQKDGGRVRKLEVSKECKFGKYSVVLSKNHLKQKELSFAKFLGVKKISHIGSVGIKLGEIAAGRAQLYINFDGLNVWDVCAPQIILEEAGGSVFDANGKELQYLQKRFRNGIIATNGKCREEIVAKMREFGSGL